MMDAYKQPDRRRNVLDVIADLGLHKEHHGPDPQAAVQAPVLALVPPVAAARDDIEQTINEARRRAADQRIAAEKFLKESVELEERLAREAEQVRAAGEHARKQQLATAVAAAALAERNASEARDAWAKKLERIAAEKREAEALKKDDQRALESARADVAAAEARLAQARRAHEIATTSCSESDRRFADACSAEEAARAEADAAAQLVLSCRTAREELEREVLCGAAADAPSVGPASPAAVDDLRAIEARRRAAERRAADLARGAAS